MVFDNPPDVGTAHRGGRPTCQRGCPVPHPTALPSASRHRTVPSTLATLAGRYVSTEAPVASPAGHRMYAATGTVRVDWFDYEPISTARR